MGDRCLYHQSNDPPELSSSGVCNNCHAHGYISYFCSRECHEHNYELHHDDFTQRDIGIHNDEDALLMYETAAGMDIIEFEDKRQESSTRDGERRDKEQTRRERTWDDGELEEGERTESV